MPEQQQTTTIGQALNLAIQHHTAGRLSEAESIYQQILENTPNHPVALHLLGVIAHQVGKNTIAVDLITKALASKPDYSEAHSNLGNLFRELGRFDEAVAHCKMAIDITPDFAKAHNNLGNALQKLGRLPEAVGSYEKALTLEPDFAQAHNNLGNVLRDFGKLEEAMSSYRKALTLDPAYAQAHYNLGNALKDLGQPVDAVASYRKALLLKPDYAEAHGNLGLALQGMGSWEEAITSYHKALEIKPDFAETHNNLGTALRALGKLDDAAASYQKALSLQPGAAEPHHNLGEVLEQLGDLQKAALHFQHSFANRTGIQPIGDGDLYPATTTLYLELTNKCNFHCTFCPSDSQKRSLGFMDLELAKRVYEEAISKKLAVQVDLHLMGEPTLHPNLIDILKFGAEKNVKTELVTNGSTLVAKVVPRILDALYGTIVASHMTPTEETYHFRGEVGLSWERYIGNIRLLVREYMRRLASGENIRNEINLRIMVTKDTASNIVTIETAEEAHTMLTEWSDFVSTIEQELDMAPFDRQELNVDDLLQRNSNTFLTYQLQRGINVTLWRAFTFANTRVSDDYDLQPTEETLFCPHPFKDVGVLWNGDVTLCCMDHDGQLKVGNVKDTSVEDVLQSETAQNLRASMLGHRPLPLVCQTCQSRPIKRDGSTQDKALENIGWHSSVDRTN